MPNGQKKIRHKIQIKSPIAYYFSHQRKLKKKTKQTFAPSLLLSNLPEIYQFFKYQSNRV